MSGQLGSRPYTGWQLLKVYWQSEQRFFAYLFLISVIIMTIAIVGMEVVFTTWYNHFYNALQDYEARNAIDLMIIFIFLASIYIILQVYRYYLQAVLGLRWRRWLTDQFLNRWLYKRSYYYLENFDEQTDNPDQRIQEDIGSLVVFTLDLSIGLIAAVTTILSFIYILWTLSGTLHVPLGKYGAIDIPGYLVWVAIIYASVGTLLTFKIGYPLVGLNFQQQRLEANFRFAAVDLRAHAEHVALYRGEHHEKNILRRLVDLFLQNWYLIILRQKLLLWFTAGYNQVAVLVPLVVALPNYFGKVFKLGGLMQTIFAFRQIQEAFSFLVNAYTRIAEWRAIMRRLLTFLNHMYELEKQVDKENKLTHESISGNKIVTKDVTLYTPQGNKLLKNISQEFDHGKNYLIKGESGIGKSTFIRAIAGIWPFGSGEIYLPQQKNLMYIPQKSYMPLGTLKEALLFPDNIKAVPDKTLIELLELCGLNNLTDELHHDARWSERLSSGELQRIAFVRVLLQKPDWVFLDESTSSLDEKNEANLYALLKAKLPHCSLITIGHHATIHKFYDHQIDLGAYKA